MEENIQRFMIQNNDDNNNNGPHCYVVVTHLTSSPNVAGSRPDEVIELYHFTSSFQPH
jgi:hypothetical protein